MCNVDCVIYISEIRIACEFYLLYFIQASEFISHLDVTVGCLVLLIYYISHGIYCVQIRPILQYLVYLMDAVTLEPCKACWYARLYATKLLQSFHKANKNLILHNWNYDNHNLDNTTKKFCMTKMKDKHLLDRPALMLQTCIEITSFLTRRVHRDIIEPPLI